MKLYGKFDGVKFDKYLLKKTPFTQLYVYRTYIGDENDSIDEIIEGIQDNIENYIEELKKLPLMIILMEI